MYFFWGGVFLVWVNVLMGIPFHSLPIVFTSGGGGTTTVSNYWGYCITTPRSNLIRISEPPYIKYLTIGSRFVFRRVKL